MRLAAGATTQRQGDGEEIQTVVQAAADALARISSGAEMLLPMYIALLEQSGMPDRREQPACAAALEYLFHRLSGRKVDLRRIAAKNGVSPRLCRMMAKQDSARRQEHGEEQNKRKCRA